MKTHAPNGRPSRTEASREPARPTRERVSEHSASTRHEAPSVAPPSLDFHLASLSIFPPDSAPSPESHPDVASALARRGGGLPLAPELRAELEPTLGVVLGGVRVHDGPAAAAAAAMLHADAFTAGHDVFFASGRFAPESADGKRLLVHELAHVAQVGRGAASAGSRLSTPGEPLEREARELAARGGEGVADRAAAPLRPLLPVPAQVPIFRDAPKPLSIPRIHLSQQGELLQLTLNGVIIAVGEGPANGSASVRTVLVEGRFGLVVQLGPGQTMRFLRPQVTQSLGAVAPVYGAVILAPGLPRGELDLGPSLEVLDKVQSSMAPSGAAKTADKPRPPPKTNQESKANATAAALASEFPLLTGEPEEVAQEPAQVPDEDTLPAGALRPRMPIELDPARPDRFLVPEGYTRPEIAAALLGDASALNLFEVEEGAAPTTAEGTPRRYVRVTAPDRLTGDALEKVRARLEQDLRSDVAWTLAKLSEGTIDDADEWELVERALRWSQYSGIRDAAGVSYFDRYLDALAARSLKQPHWYTLTLTSASHTALEWLLIETEEKAEQLQKAIALRSKKHKVAYTVTDAAPALARGDVAGRFFWSSGGGIQIHVITQLADEPTLERADIRTRNSTVWGGMRILIPGADGRFRGYGVDFATILGNTHPLDDPSGHFAWYYPGTIFIRPGETRLGQGAGEGDALALRQSIVTDALAQATVEKPWPLLGLDYDVLELFTPAQRAEAFEKVIGGPGLEHPNGIGFLARVLASTSDRDFPLLERKLTDGGVLLKLMASNSPAKMELGQAFTLKALAAEPLALDSLDKLPTFHLGREGETTHMLSTPVEQVSTQLVEPGKWDPMQGVSLRAEPAAPGETPGPATRTALRFQPVTHRFQARYTSTSELGAKSRALHPLELVRVELHGPKPQVRIMTAMELMLTASIADPSLIWSAVGRIGEMHMIYGGVSGLARGLAAAPLTAEGALARAEGAVAAEGVAAARQAAVRQFIGRALLVSTMAAVDTYRDELSKTEEGRAFLAVYDVAMVALAARDIYRLASSGMLRELVVRGEALLRRLGSGASASLREAIDSAKALQLTIDRLLAEKKISITPEGVVWNVAEGEGAFKQIFFSVRAELAAGRTVSGLRAAGLSTATAERTLEALKELAKESEEAARAYNAVARRAAGMPAAEADRYLSAIDSLRSATPSTLRGGLPSILRASGTAAAADPVALLQDAEWLFKQPGLSADAAQTLAAKVAESALDLRWLRTTSLTMEDLNFLARDPKTPWDLLRRAAADPNNRALQILARTRLRGIAGEVVTERSASKVFPGYRLTGRQVDLPGGHVVDFELAATDGTGLRHALEVKGWTRDVWRDALNAWVAAGSPVGEEAMVLAAANVSKDQARLLKQLGGLVAQLGDAASAPRGNPFLVVTSGLSGPTSTKLRAFLSKMAPGVEVRAISEEEILAASRRLRSAFGLPEALPEVPE